MLNTANCTPVNKIIVFFWQYILQDRQDAFSSDHFTSSASQPTPIDMTQRTLTLGRKKHSVFYKKQLNEKKKFKFSWRN